MESLGQVVIDERMQRIFDVRHLAFAQKLARLSAMIVVIYDTRECESASQLGASCSQRWRYIFVTVLTMDREVIVPRPSDIKANQRTSPYAQIEFFWVRLPVFPLIYSTY